MKVGPAWLGKVELTLALVVAKHFEVKAVDLNPSIIRKIKSYEHFYEENVDKYLEKYGRRFMRARIAVLAKIKGVLQPYYDGVRKSYTRFEQPDYIFVGSEEPEIRDEVENLWSKIFNKQSEILGREMT